MASDLDRLLVEALRGNTYTPTPENVKNVAPAPLAGMLGAPGDIQAMAQWAGNKLAPLLAKQPGGDLIGAVMGMAQGRSGPTTEELGAVLGANPNSPEFQVASFGAPDMSDVGRIGLAQALFHGTPHKFDKFDLSKIGTGEGAQVYGHGLYFAENPNVAKQYQITLAKPPTISRATMAALERNDLFGFSSVKEAVKNIRKHPDWAKRWDVDPKDVPIIQKHLESEVGSHLYEVDIPDEVIDQMLDWDAPLSEQPEILGAMRRLNKNITENMTGGEAYSYMSRSNSWSPGDVMDQTLDSLGPQGTMKEGASRLLNEAGIPGIRFYDGGSRKAGEGTRNIVVFDPDSTIRKVKRDGKLVHENTDLAKALRDGK